MQRKLLVVAALLFILLPGLQTKAQPGTASFNADADLTIGTSFGCTPSIFPLPVEQMNWDGYDLTYGDWTIGALGCGYSSTMFLVRFATMALPINAHVMSARLNLFGPPSSGFVPQGNSYYGGSWFGPNPGYVDRIVRSGAGISWNENTETWNSFYAGYGASGTHITPTLNSYSGFAYTTSQWNENFSIDVTDLTKDIIAAGTNDGYILYLQSTPPSISPSPSPYQSVVFADRTSTTGVPQPQLVIDYYICNANFTYCSSTEHPWTYNFEAIDPGFPGATYQWTFGDGATGHGPHATHTYPGPGTYRACLTLYDDRGNFLCEKCVTFCINDKDNGEDPHEKTTPQETKTQPINASPLGVRKHGDISLADKTLNITKVSPNPASTNIEVSLLMLRKSDVNYKIFDLQGKEVMKDNMQVGQGKQSISISIGKLQPGIYILKMGDGYTTAEYKFTKE